jgi:ApaG protein
MGSALQPPMSDNDFEISIEVATDYVDDQSEPDVGRYVFAYTITISNRGNVPAKLLSRHWLITDANGKVQEVRGDGVVGEQPHLNPGEKFRYSSGAVLETPVGAMQGSYRMKADNGISFDAPIPPFTLAVPGVLH